MRLSVGCGQRSGRGPHGQHRGGPPSPAQRRRLGDLGSAWWSWPVGGGVSGEGGILLSLPCPYGGPGGGGVAMGISTHLLFFCFSAVRRAEQKQRRPPIAPCMPPAHQVTLLPVWQDLPKTKNRAVRGRRAPRQPPYPDAAGPGHRETPQIFREKNWYSFPHKKRPLV